jgi:hypothetical protein
MEWDVVHEVYRRRCLGEQNPQDGLCVRDPGGVAPVLDEAGDGNQTHELKFEVLREGVEPVFLTPHTFCECRGGTYRPVHTSRRLAYSRLVYSSPSTRTQSRPQCIDFALPALCRERWETRPAGYPGQKSVN